MLADRRGRRARCRPTAACADASPRASKAGRGVRFEAALATELRPRPGRGRRAHVPDLRRARRRRSRGRSACRCCSGSRTGSARGRCALAERASTAVVSRRPALVPARLAEGRRRSGTASTSREFPCRERRPARERLPRASRSAATRAAKGLETIVRAVGAARRRRPRAARPRARPTAEERAPRRARAARRRARPRHARPARHAVLRRGPGAARPSRTCLVNNMRAGALDKVVYEAAATCMPVLASNPGFDELLDGPSCRSSPATTRTSWPRSCERCATLTPANALDRPHAARAGRGRPLGRALGRPRSSRWRAMRR